MSRIKCLLVDDEVPAIQLLDKYAGMIEQLEVVGTCHSAVQAFDRLQKSDVDLLFLDIRMPVLNGIDFLKSLKHPPAVILTTAYREYALEGYDLDIIDYLLKPIAFDRFLKSVDRYRQRKVTPTKIPSAHGEIGTHIYFTINRAQHKVIFDEILYIESLKDYVRIHMKDNHLIVKGNIGSIMRQLPAEKFIRIHRSYAVAIDKMSSYNQSKVVIGEKTLPIGIRYKGKLQLL